MVRILILALFSFLTCFDDFGPDLFFFLIVFHQRPDEIKIQKDCLSIFRGDDDVVIPVLVRPASCEECFFRVIHGDLL